MFRFRYITLTERFFYLFGILIFLLASSFLLPWMFSISIVAFAVLLAVGIADAFILFAKKEAFKVERDAERVLSLSDENEIRIKVRNLSNLGLKCILYDDLPFQLQVRNLDFRFSLRSGETKKITYSVRPVKRGVYTFGEIKIFCRSFLGIVERNFTVDATNDYAVYPSIIQMKKYELKTIERIATFHGIKKLRRIGHSYEFDTIKNYVRGDDYRAINWKATSRRASLMVNQYVDEKSQNVYAIIDKSRSMAMPFNDLSLMDYAVNTSLVIGNTAIQKDDRAGLLTFSDSVGTILKADNGKTQLKKIMEALYNEKERQEEANFEILYHAVNKVISSRSLIFLYTNFESLYSAERALSILRRINLKHLLVLVFFENSEISEYGMTDAKRLEDVYLTTIAKKFTSEKMQIVRMLRQYGIQVILSKPEDLSINSINKYLELKARGLI